MPEEGRRKIKLPPPKKSRRKSDRDKRFDSDMKQLEEANRLCVRYKGTDKYEWACQQAIYALERVNSYRYS